MELGTFIDFGGRPAVRFERRYSHSIERVWSAVSDPGELSCWFPARVDYEPHVGATVSFTGDPHTGPTSGTILDYDPPRRLSLSWMGDELHLALEPDGDGGCRLELINVLSDRDTAARNATGWTVCVGELDKLLSTGRADGPHSDAAMPGKPVWEAYVAAGMPSAAGIPG